MPDDPVVLDIIAGLPSLEGTVVTPRQQPLTEKPHPDKSKVSPRLRSQTRTISSSEAKNSFKLDENWRPLQYIVNDYEDRGELVFDRATELLWQKSGSRRQLNYGRAQKYIEQLNRDRFGGFSDWRLPTVPELMSLLEPQKQANGLYIEPIFDAVQGWCWSSDKRSAWSAWYVNFYKSYVRWYSLSSSTTSGPFTSWARGVRSSSIIGTPLNQ